MKKPRQTARVAEREFWQKTLDSLLSHIVILSEEGEILAVNAAWNRYACDNGLEEGYCGPGANYLRACDQATGECSEEAGFVARGIREVIARREESFSIEYPCHSPTERRWFLVRITRFEVDGVVRVVVSHDDITRRKLAELQYRKAVHLLKLQVSTDGLTGIANRRCFDRELARAWRILARVGRPLSVLMIDVDHFKQYNDGAGHLAGDDCLKLIAGAIRSSLDPARGLVARYGGEEFAAILPRLGERRAAEVADDVLKAVGRLAIPHPNPRTDRGVVSVSIGCSTAIPDPEELPFGLLLRADRALYEAKAGGRDRVVVAGSLWLIPSDRTSAASET